MCTYVPARPMDPKKPIDCIVCGSCVADVLVRPVPLDAPLEAGSVIPVDPIEVTTGGLVCNAGIAMARLGGNVAALAYVGDDPWAALIRGKLADERVDIQGLTPHSNAATTTAIVLIDSAGQRSFAYDPGATEQTDRQVFLPQIDRFRESRMALVGYYSLLPNLEDDLPELLAAIRERGCQTALDSAGDGGRMQPLDRILPHLDVYVPSHAEGVGQTGRSNPEEIIDVYRGFGAEGLLGVKLGSEGALLSPARGEFVKIDPALPPGPVVDTTGAGDCFYAGLLTGLLKGRSVEESGRLAAACGACSVTAKGATAAVADLPTTIRLAGISR